MAIEDLNPKATERIRKLLVALAEGKADPGEFAPQLRAILFPDRAKEAQNLFTSFGPLNKLEVLESREEDGALHRRYRATFGETPVQAFFTIDKEGKIAGAGIMPE